MSLVQKDRAKTTAEEKSPERKALGLVSREDEEATDGTTSPMHVTAVDAERRQTKGNVRVVNEDQQLSTRSTSLSLEQQQQPFEQHRQEETQFEPHLPLSFAFT